MRAILTYHSIDDSGSVISISPEVFKEHLAWLSQGGIRVLSLPDLLAADSRQPTDAVAITFDDGFANVRAVARELQGRGLPATVFVVTGHVGGDNAWGGRPAPGIPVLPLMGWADLETLVAHGFEIGAHTHTHPPLSTLSSSAIEDELDRCGDLVRERLGVDPAFLAYPYGSVDARVASVAAKRFAGGVTTEFRALPAHGPVMRIPRIDMYYFRRAGAIARWGAPGFRAWLRWVHVRRALRKAWVRVSL